MSDWWFVLLIVILALCAAQFITKLFDRLYNNDTPNGYWDEHEPK